MIITNRTPGPAAHLTLGQASPKVITLSLIYFGFVGALYGMQFWLPQIAKAFGFSNAQAGFVTAVPYLFGSVAMVFWARHSDATRERIAHVGLPLLLTAAALAVCGYMDNPYVTTAANPLHLDGVAGARGLAAGRRSPGFPRRSRDQGGIRKRGRGEVTG